MMSRVSSRVNKGNSLVKKFKPFTPKLAPKQPAAQAPPPPAAADVAMPAILFDIPNNDDMNENIEML